MRPLYIFDIDGTLCNIEHRLHYIDKTKGKPNWNAFHKACVNDVPNHPVLTTMHRLHNSGADIWLFSGRSEEVRAETIQWLHRNTNIPTAPFLQDRELLTMRPAGDFTEDHLLKQSWLRRMLHEDLDRLVAVFDDRKRVVDMWRANGVPCFQVAPGEF